MYNGLQQDSMQELLKPFWAGSRQARMHVARAEEKDGSGLLEGYIEDSLIGTISLPPGMQAEQRDSGWQWSGNGLK
jgi:hypothetical protein